MTIYQDECLPTIVELPSRVLVKLRGFGLLFRNSLVSLLFAFLMAPVWANTELPTPLKESDFRQLNTQAAKLGRLLFYDKVLSGNQNIACSTCHHHDLASGDGLSLGLGEGGIGLGTKRIVGKGESKVKRRVPRNASALFNVGAKEFTHFSMMGVSLSMTFSPVVLIPLQKSFYQQA